MSFGLYILLHWHCIMCHSSYTLCLSLSADRRGVMCRVHILHVIATEVTRRYIRFLQCFVEVLILKIGLGTSMELFEIKHFFLLFANVTHIDTHWSVCQCWRPSQGYSGPSLICTSRAIVAETSKPFSNIFYLISQLRSCQRYITLVQLLHECRN